MAISTKYRLSRHARRRMAQRNLSLADLALVLRFGRKTYRTGVKFFFLGKRDLPSDAKQLERLVGTTVVTAKNRIVTAYRNRKAFARIKRKLKWQRIQREQRAFFTWENESTLRSNAFTRLDHVA